MLGRRMPVMDYTGMVPPGDRTQAHGEIRLALSPQYRALSPERRGGSVYSLKPSFSLMALSRMFISRMGLMKISPLLIPIRSMITGR